MINDLRCAVCSRVRKRCRPALRCDYVAIMSSLSSCSWRMSCPLFSPPTTQSNRKEMPVKSSRECHKYKRIDYDDARCGSLKKEKTILLCVLVLCGGVVSQQLMVVIDSKAKHGLIIE